MRFKAMRVPQLLPRLFPACAKVLISARSPKPADGLLKRMNSAFIGHLMSRKKAFWPIWE
jgi:hypothetical protein